MPGEPGISTRPFSHCERGTTTRCGEGDAHVTVVISHLLVPATVSTVVTSSSFDRLQALLQRPAVASISPAL
ncbi:hypothetical protein BRM83_07615, partial [Xanthomonas oryzae pv. oryzae]